MAVGNQAIAAAFDELADLLELQEANPFRVRAYRNGAQSLRNQAQPIQDLLKQGKDLSELPGIGDDLAAKIKEMLATGTLQALEAERRRIPQGVVAMMRLPGLGPKRAKALHDQLAVTNLEDLKDAASQGRVRALKGFGTTSEAKILAALEGSTGERWLRAEVEKEAGSLLELLQPHVDWIEVAGSFRRQRATVGDLDLIAVCADGAGAMAAFTANTDVDEVVSQGSTRSTVHLRGGLQVDLRVVKAEAGGSALLYFTGSKNHNIALRRLAQERGWKLNEYGLWASNDRRLAGDSEEAIYARLDLAWIAPELRENTGEIEAARDRHLPKLVELTDLRGDLHSTAPNADGQQAIAAMVRAARAMGLHYLSITDQGGVSRVASDAHDAMAHHIAAVEQAARDIRGRFRLLKGAEVAILEDGSLNARDDLLEQVDIVIASVHKATDPARQTRSLLRAMEHPLVDVIGLPSSRVPSARASTEMDFDKLIAKAAQTGTMLELNSRPGQVNLDPHQCRAAKEAGAKLVINSHARAPEELSNLRHGVGQARRGWMESPDVATTLTWKQLEKQLKRNR